MPQFDVHPLADGGLSVDCQSDILRFLDTRFVVPLLPSGVVIETAGLNPGFSVDGALMSLYPQGAAIVPKTELGRSIASLADERYKIRNALDMLLTGF